MTDKVNDPEQTAPPAAKPKKASAKKTKAAPAAASSSVKKPDRETLFLIDGSGYIFRAYYAMRRLTTSKGQATNAVFGFTTMLLKVIKEHQPTHLAIAFDLPVKTFRHTMYPAYKANRSAPPEDLPPQIPLIHRLVDNMRIQKLIKAGYEADDLIGHAARVAVEQGRDVVIITGDKDLMQLVDPHTSLLDELRQQRSSDAAPLIGREQVIEKFGVPPERVIDVLALAGDASDNVPGVKGIGEKTAAELVNSFGDLEAVLAAAPGIKQQARRERLIEQADSARISKQLVTIERNVPDFAFSIDAVAYLGPDRAGLRAFFEEMEFRRLTTDPIVRDENDQPADAPPIVAGKAGQGDLFATAPEPEAAPTITLDQSRYRAVLDEEGLREVSMALALAPRFALRTEVDRPGAPDAALVGVAVSWGEGEAAWLPVASLSADRIKAALSPLLSDTAKQIVAHDAKTDVNALSFAGWPDWRPSSDPMLASYLLDADAEVHTLANVTRRYVGHLMVEPDAVFLRGKESRGPADVPLATMTTYACEAVDCTLRASRVIEPKIDAEGLRPLYEELELPLEALLGKMERAGIRVDTKRLAGMSDAFQIEMNALEEKAYAAAGRSFNLGSPQQIAELLFTELKLPIIKRTKTGPSTDSTVLEALSEKHDLPALILEHRVVSKLKNTYLDVLPKLVDGEGRVHTHFNQAVAATGRLSSTDPNLQNIPIRTELGRKIRDAFVAKDGCVLLSLDYSQIELRILAHVSGDAVLVDTFERNLDVHARTASEVFKVDLKDVTRDQRTAAKAINFGLLYGMGVVRLARELGIKRAEAKAYLDVYFERLEGIRRWHADALERAHVEREVRTLLGRRRKLPELDSKNPGSRARAERLAINTPIQGSAADIIKRAMINADLALSREVPSARILLQVHDELVIEVPRADADRALDVARRAMEGAMTLRVPLVVDGRQGHTWNEAH